MKKYKKAIGIVDSGIGGFTVLEELIKILPNEKYLYVADQKFCPYSNLSNSLIKERLEKIFHYFEKKKVKLIVIACNTASIFINYLKKQTKIPIISVINPTCKEVMKNTKNKNVGLLATKTTIDSKIYQTILEKEKINTYGVACSEFVKIIEDNQINTLNTKMIIENKLNNLINSNIDTLVYGCTHFSLLHEHIKPYFKNIKYVSSKMPTANYVYIYLRSQDLLNKQKIIHKVKIKTTYNKRKIKKQIKLFKIKKYRISKINI